MESCAPILLFVAHNGALFHCQSCAPFDALHAKLMSYTAYHNILNPVVCVPLCYSKVPCESGRGMRTSLKLRSEQTVPCHWPLREGAQKPQKISVLPC